MGAKCCFEIFKELLKFYGPVMCRNRPDVGNIIPITRLLPGCFTFCKTCHVIYLYWYFKNCQLWVLKYTTIHHFQVGPDIKLDLWSHIDRQIWRDRQNWRLHPTAVVHLQNPVCTYTSSSIRRRRDFSSPTEIRMLLQATVSVTVLVLTRFTRFSACSPPCYLHVVLASITNS